MIAGTRVVVGPGRDASHPRVVLPDRLSPAGRYDKYARRFTRQTMNEHDESEFDDPGLKAAVGRTLGGEAAPPMLRARVKALMAAEAAAVTGAAAADEAAASPASAPAPARPRGRLVIDRGFWRIAAAAACVLLAVGFMAYQYQREFGFRPAVVAAPTTSVTSIPASLVLEIVRTHDNCAKLPDHH